MNDRPKDRFMSDAMEARRGLLAMIVACVIWGLSGIFYHQLAHVPAIEVLSWRTVSSLVFLLMVMAALRRLGRVRTALSDVRVLRRLVLASAMISLNWFLFIFAIQSGQAMEASLGYYVFPLIAVLLGRLVFGEMLRPLQWVSVGLAGGAVAILAWGLGVAPWIALALALTFASYGVLKKGVGAGPLSSVTIEVLILTPFALIWMFVFGQGVNWDLRTLALLAAAGVVTGGPLLLFAYAAQRVRLSTIGLVQYLNPTLQFGVATLILAEPFTLWHGVAFPMIWLGLALYSWAGWPRPDIRK